MSKNTTIAPAGNTSYTTTIDWQSFVVEHEGTRGISLRKLVEAGLYSRLDHAVTALESSGLDFSRVRGESTGGRPSTDHIFTDIADAQMFCTMARTETGKQITRLIIEHHVEFQKLLAGDVEAHQQLAAVVPEISVEAQLAALDPMLAMVYRIKLDQAQQEQRLTALEHHRAERAPDAHLGWRTASEVANMLKLTTKNGYTPNSQAVTRMVRNAQLDQHMKQLDRLVNGHAVLEYVISPQGVAELMKLVPQTFEPGTNIMEPDASGKRLTVNYRP